MTWELEERDIATYQGKTIFYTERFPFRFWSKVEYFKDDLES